MTREDIKMNDKMRTYYFNVEGYEGMRKPVEAESESQAINRFLQDVNIEVE